MSIDTSIPTSTVNKKKVIVQSMDIFKGKCVQEKVNICTNKSSKLKFYILITRHVQDTNLY